MSNAKVENLFTDLKEAQRYDKYRPTYHDLPFAELQKYLGKKLGKTLDVACGTGHSTLALSKICESVIGCDISREMIRVAERKGPTTFVEASAEEIPFPANSFDHINVSMGFQWLNQAKFLSEALRLLKPGRHLSIDNYGFVGTMQGNDKFKAAYQTFDQTNMPRAARHPNFPDEDLMVAHGFKFLHEIKYQQVVTMDVETFTEYLMTRSNFLHLNSDTKPVVAQRIKEFYPPFFMGQPRKLEFSGQLKLYRKI